VAPFRVLIDPGGSYCWDTIMLLPAALTFPSFATLVRDASLVGVVMALMSSVTSSHRKLIHGETFVDYKSRNEKCVQCEPESNLHTVKNLRSWPGSTKLHRVAPSAVGQLEGECRKQSHAHTNACAGKSIKRCQRMSA